MNGGLAILDAVRMPYGCGTWPSWWTTDVPHWPWNGEIDILEGVNGYTRNQASLHTAPGCTIPTDYGSTGTLAASTNCGSGDTGNQGCGQLGTASNGYGKPFNDNGGGVYAMASGPALRDPGQRLGLAAKQTVALPPLASAIALIMYETTAPLSQMLVRPKLRITAVD
ncbi:unnamed protein product [Rhizoctonia solani]|uniref:GH16 domain-containing protein n=1 Tax=Rhizoctonia solani TaxID=456999 RepID=A0A8H3H3V3_9AGAM|nr:unnamed protein product [Rhizoctonia solani]